MKKIVVFGGTGGLGQKLIPLLEKRYEVTSVGSKDVDITSFEQVKKFFTTNEFDIVLNMSGIKYDVFLNEIKENDLKEINRMIDVNISNRLLKLITEVYYWERMGFEIPHYCTEAFSKRAEIRNTREIVLTIVLDYNK